MEEGAKKQTGWTIASMVVLILDMIGCIVLAAITLNTSAKFKAIFADLGVQLPQITQVLVSLPAALYMVIFLGLIIALVLKEKVMRSKLMAFTVNLGVLVGGIAYLAVYVAAMFFPIVQHIQAIEKTN